MPQQQVSHWLSITLTLVNKSTLVETNISLINKPQLDPGNADGNAQYYPILIGGTRMGTASDREMILSEAGSITINNAIGSFGVDRKFSDILDRHEIIDQQIYILYGTSTLEGLKADTYISAYYAKVLDWTHAIDQNQPVVDIRFDAKVIPKRVINRKIDTDLFSAAMFSSIGKSLPVVFGSDIQVKPIKVSSDTASTTSTSHAYATTLSDEHQIGGVSTYYAADLDGKYIDVISSSAANTAMISRTGGATNVNVSTDEIAFFAKLTTETTYNILASSVEVGFHGWGVAALYDGAITIKILDGSDTEPGVRVLATGTVNANAYDSSFDAGADFYIFFSLDKPVVFESTKAYWISVNHDYISANPISVTTTAAGASRWHRAIAGNGWKSSATATTLNLKVYSVKFTDVATGTGTADLQGLGAAYFASQQHSSSLTNISNVDYVLSVNGLKDDSGGSITGSASSQIDTIHHAIKLMSQDWNGTSWSASTNFDFTDYSATYFSTNVIAGSTDGETTFEQWLRQVCRNSATRCVLASDGAVAPYSWGTTLTSQATFTQENSKVTRLEQLDSSYVVNRVTVAYKRALIYFDSIIAASQGISSDYTLIMNRNSATSTEYETLIGYSEDIYGARELADIYFNWLNDGTAATRVARYYLTNFNTPPKYIEIEAPFNDFSTLALMNVVTVINPSLPNYYGGIPNAKLPHYLGEEVDPLDGYNLCEAQSYRAQIEGRTITFNEDAAPTLNLICRLLTNYPNDPT